MPTEDPPTPAITEPEIRFLARVVGACLLAFRWATLIAGGYAIYYAVRGILTETKNEGYYVWLCIGLPAFLPVHWLISWRSALLLIPALALWFGPSQLPEDSDYGYIIRMFATGVAISVLVVWRTVYRLLPPAESLSAVPPAPQPDPAPTPAAAARTQSGDAH